MLLHLAATGGSFPPDTMGDVSAQQVIIALNGLIRSFDRAGNPDGALEITPEVFLNQFLAELILQIHVFVLTKQAVVGLS